MSIPGQPGGDLYRLVVENSLDFITIWDAQGRTVYDNPAALGLLEEAKRLAGEPLRVGALAHPDDRERIQVEFEKLRDSGGSTRIEYRLQLPGGEIRWIDALVIAVPGLDGVTERVIWVRRDVSEHRRWVEKLRENEVLFRRLADNTSDIILLIGLDGRLEYASPSFYRLFEVEQDVLHHVGTHLHPEDRARVLAHVHELLTEGTPQRSEYRVILATGAVAWLEAYAEPVYNEERTIIGGRVVARDITNRRQAEEQLAQNEAKYRLLADNLTDLVQLFDRDGRSLYDSPSVLNLYGDQYRIDRKLGDGNRTLIHPDDRERLWTGFQRVVASGVVDQGECRIVLPSGEQRELEYAAKPIFGTPGWVEKVLIVSRDITERKRAEQALAESEEKYRLLADNQTDYLQLTGVDGRIMYDSPSLVRVLGPRYQPNRLLAGPDSTLIHPDDRARVYQDFLDLCANGGQKVGELRWLLPSGEVRWVEITATAIAGRDGKIDRVLGVSRDITDRKLAEQALAASEAQYRLLADNQTDYMQLVDLQGTIHYDSPSLIKLLGPYYKPHRTLNEPGFTIVHPDDQALVRQGFQELAAKGGELRYEYRWLLPSGEVRWVEARGKAIPGPDGKIDKLLGVTRDITERKLAELALAESESRYRLLADNSEDFILLLDSGGGVVFQSPSVARSMGEFARADGAILEIVIAEDRQRVQRALQRIFDEGIVQTIEFRVEVLPGVVRWLEAIGKPVEDPVSGAKMVLASSRDITKRKRAEELAYQSQKMEALGLLTGGLAHDFNNLLGVMIGNLDILEEALPEQPGLLKRLTIARDAALKAAHVTKAMLAVAQRQPMNVVRRDLNDLVREDETLIVTSIGRSCEVVFEVFPEPLPIHCDLSSFSNSLLNLVINARDAMKQGGGVAPKLIVQTTRVSIHSDAELSAGDYAVLSVIDNGTGMPADVIAKAFDPFFTTKPRDKGTGLGLSMVYGYARQLGGTVRIDSTVGTGTAVEIFLPIDTDQNNAADSAAA